MERKKWLAEELAREGKELRMEIKKENRGKDAEKEENEVERKRNKNDRGEDREKEEKLRWK